MHLHRPREFFRRLGDSGLIGFGESYLAGEWDSTDLTGLLTVFAAHAADLVPPWLQRLRRLAVRRQPPDDLQTIAGRAAQHRPPLRPVQRPVRAVPRRDHDLLQRPVPRDADGVPVAADLAEAQRRKIDRLLDRAGVGPGCRLLEVGTGWGELAIRAARRGATVRTITISREQQALAARRVAEAGLAGQVSVELRDYRDVDGRFDAICSVEMLEAVGERYWDAYFAALDRLPGPGRADRAADDHDGARPDAGHPAHLHLDPEVHLPRRPAPVRHRDPGQPGPHHAADHRARGLRRRTTPRRCGSGGNGSARGPTRSPRLGFDEVFNRMWTFYLCYSEAGFRAGYIDVSQLTLARTPL